MISRVYLFCNKLNIYAGIPILPYRAHYMTIILNIGICIYLKNVLYLKIGANTGDTTTTKLSNDTLLKTSLEKINKTCKNVFCF